MKVPAGVPFFPSAMRRRERAAGSCGHLDENPFHSFHFYCLEFRTDAARLGSEMWATDAHISLAGSFDLSMNAR